MYGRVPPRPAAIFSSQVDAAMVGALSAFGGKADIRRTLRNVSACDP